MKIQGILDSAVEPETVHLRAGTPADAGRPKAKAGSPEPGKPPAPPAADYAKELERIAAAIRKYIRYHPTSVDITVDAELRQIVTRVIDEDSGKIIRQYPEDAALEVMKHLKELRGLLLHEKG